MSTRLERELRDAVAGFPRPDERSVRAVEEQVLAVRRKARQRAARAASVRALTAAAALTAAFLVGSTSNATGGAEYAAAPGDPTLQVRKYTIGQAVRLDLSGRIPSERAGEYVEILERECGSAHFRVANGASTVAGGFWEKNEMFFFTTVTYVARWNGRLSDEVIVRSPLYVLPFPLKNRRWRIAVNTRIQSMAGRTIVLQRKTADDTWARVRSVKLGPGRYFGSYEAIVRIPTHGLTMRVLVPQASARPCHDAIVSPSWPT